MTTTALPPVSETLVPGQSLAITFLFPSALPDTTEASSVSWVIEDNAITASDFSLSPGVNDVSVPTNGLTEQLTISATAGVGDTFSIIFTQTDTFTVAGATPITESVQIEYDITVGSNGTIPTIPPPVVQVIRNIVTQQVAANQQLQYDTQQIAPYQAGVKNAEATFNSLGDQAYYQALELSIAGLKYAADIYHVLELAGCPVEEAIVGMAAIATTEEVATATTNFVQLFTTLQNGNDPNASFFQQAEATALNAVAALKGSFAPELLLQNVMKDEIETWNTTKDFLTDFPKTLSQLAAADQNYTTAVNAPVFYNHLAQGTPTVQWSIDTTNDIHGYANYLGESMQIVLVPSGNQVVSVLPSSGGQSSSALTASSSAVSVATSTDTVLSLLGANQIVSLDSSLTGQLIVDGTNTNSDNTVTIAANYRSFQISLIPGEVIIQNGSNTFTALIENIDKIVFNDRTITFDASGDPLVNAIGVPSTGNIYDVTGGQTVISGFNQGPFYDPLHGDKIFFTDATAAPSVSNFIAVPDLVNSYQDALSLATALLQNYRYVAIAYDQGTSDAGSTTIQPATGQDFLLIFADTTGNHQADAIVRLTGLDSPSEISFTDLLSPIVGPTLTAADVNNVYLAVLQRSALQSEIASWQTKDALGGDAAVIADIVNSSEAQFNVYPVVQIIKLALGNYPTAAQLAGWVPFVESNGLLQGQSQTNPLLDQMATAFVASDNFGKVYNNGVDVDPNSAVNAHEMQIIIQAATGIAATQPQINAWLSTGLTIDQVFVDFALGDQYTKASQTSVQQFLITLADNAAGIQVSGIAAGAEMHAA